MDHFSVWIHKSVLMILAVSSFVVAEQKLRSQLFSVYHRSKRSFCQTQLNSRRKRRIQLLKDHFVYFYSDIPQKHYIYKALQLFKNQMEYFYIKHFRTMQPFYVQLQHFMKYSWEMTGFFSLHRTKTFLNIFAKHIFFGQQQKLQLFLITLKSATFSNKTFLKEWHFTRRFHGTQHLVKNTSATVLSQQLQLFVNA